MLFLGQAPFRDRRDAGRQLAAELRKAGLSDDAGPGIVVVALPRGGVPVGYEVARALDAALGALVVRKLGAPGNPELAIGALASDGTLVRDETVISQLGVSEDYIDTEVSRQQAEIDRRLAAHDATLFSPQVARKTAVVVDDGVATGSTLEAALRALRQNSPRRLMAAVPVGSKDVLDRLGGLADGVVAVRQPDMVLGVGAWYRDFSQTSDDEVVRLLRGADEEG